MAASIVHVDSKLTYHATILDFVTHTVSPLTHIFAKRHEDGGLQHVGEATGLGDVVVRGFTGCATSAELLTRAWSRPAPADRRRVEHAGHGLRTACAILSGRKRERLAPHANIGYTLDAAATRR
ncbi:MAG: hypothetical protein U0Q11_25105 [Vicinamibacterales bacterium]